MVFDAVKKILLRMARKIVENVVSQLTQQVNVVQEQAMNPMRAMVQQVTDGVWRGEGANRFVEEVSSLMIPGVEKAAGQINSMSSNLQFARDTIDRADDEVAKLVRSRLVDAFKFY